MANSTRSSHTAKDEENNSGRVTRSAEKGKINSNPNVSDTTGLRRSTRETPSKKIIPSPSSTRKSERLEKRTPPNPAVKRKSERVDKNKMPDPLRRSGRTRSQSSSSPSDSKSSGSLSSKQKPKKEKSVKQLTFEAKEVNENEEVGTSQVKIKRMDAHMYRSIFKKLKKVNIADCLVEPNRIGKSNQESDDNSGAKIDESSKGSLSDCKEVSKNDTPLSEDAKAKMTIANSRLNGPAKGLAENNVTPDSLVPSNAPTHESSTIPETLQSDFCEKETLQMAVSRNSILDKDLVRMSVGHDRGEKLVHFKRKAITVDMDSDVSATLNKDDNSNLIPDASPSSIGDIIVGTNRSSSKRTRLDYSPPVNDSCNPSTNEVQDGDEIDASMPQKDCPENVAKNICLICKSEGQLLVCGGKGCNGCYHLSCLEPSLLDATLGVLHCHCCVRKKIEFGVYSVSEGVESVYDVKEASFSNVDGFTSQKEFLVKYKDLAHVHNRWLPENQLLLEAPSVLMKFNQHDQNLRLKPEWSLPHRLLHKRALICSKRHDDHSNTLAVDNFGRCYEWLVKWRCLGYEHATWELDDASFLCSPEGQSLIRGYEERFKRAKRISACSKSDKKPDQGNNITKLSQMPGGAFAGFGNSNLDAVNKLCEYWHKGQNAIVIDDHDRILKVVAFILSVHSDTSRPFLIISTATSVHLWEEGFYQLDPSIDVVIYDGNKEIRKIIRRLEFYDEEGCILFQVLIVVPEILIEDMDVLAGIEWEAIIVDECQSSKVSTHFNQMRILKTHLRILLLRGQLKDSIAENINILALLDGQSDDALMSNSSINAVELKERLSSHIAYRCKSDFFRFVEYWVPVQISHVQLEQYCATLLSNASILRSSSKVDVVGAIRDILISIRKCCNHPFVIDPSLQPLLIKGLEPAEFLDVGIKASGKLQLLDSMLMELRKNNLRALVLFQFIGGSGRDTIGDILDDFLRQRFGLDSYERVDKHLSSSKKQAAMKKFNDKNNGRFVFLLETSGCSPSIKLSSIDTIIIFDSDWNPMNDIRSLQKITLDSQFELIKIFRLYSAFTVEEKALILAKQDKTLDINLQNINRGTSHMLLMWGASCLFDELRFFHDGVSTSSSRPLFGRPLLKEATHEFSSMLTQDGEDTDIGNCSILLKVQLNWGTYRGNSSVLGETKLRLLDKESPQIFWTRLLEGKQFQWKYSCSSSQRSRKKVQQFDGSVDGSEVVSEGIAKKRRKVSNNTVDQPSSKSEGGKLSTGVNADKPQDNDAASEKKNGVHDEQRSLHLLLKPKITKLCEVLLLPDNVKRMADNFLEYVMNNHHVNREPVSILQAFQLSLSWTAASLLKHKLDHKASLILAKQHLNFDCKKEEVDYIYSMLRCLKKIFLYRTGNYNDTDSPKASETSNRVYSCTGVEQEVELFKKDMSKSIKEIRKKCNKQLKKLQLMQQDDKKRLRAAIEVEKADFEKRYKIELAFIRSCSANDLMRTEKLKDLNSEYEKGIVEMKCQHETRLKVLEDMQLAQMLKFRERETTWVEDVKSWAQNELLNIVPSTELGTGVENLQICDQVQPHHVPKNHFAGKGHGNMVEAMTSTGTEVTEMNSPLFVPSNSTVELQNPLVKHVGVNEMGITVSENLPVSGSGGLNIAENQHDSQVTTICKHSHARDQNSDGATSMTDEGSGCENIIHESGDDCRVDAVTLVHPSSNEEIYDGETLDIPSEEVAQEICRTSHSNDGQDKVHSSTQKELNGTMLSTSGCGFSLKVKPNGFSDGTKDTASLYSQSPEKHVTGVDPISLPDGENALQIHRADDCNGSNNSLTVNSPLSDERIGDGARLSVVYKETPLGIPGTVSITDCAEKVTSVNPPSSMEKISDGDAVNKFSDSGYSRSCGTAGPSHDLNNATLLSPHLGHQNSDRDSPSIPEGQIPAEVQDTSNDGDSVSVLEKQVPVEMPGTVNFTSSPQNATSLNSPSSPRQISDTGLLDVPFIDGVLASKHFQAAGSVNVMEPLGPGLQLSSVESPPDQDTAGELRNSLEQVELVSSSVDVVPANHVSSIMTPSEQVHELPCTELPSHPDSSNFPLVTEGDHQLINEDDLLSHPEASTVVPNQDVVQPASNLELDSHSHQAVHPASNSDLDSLTPGGVRTQSSNPRNLSTPVEISNHPLQTATHSASRMLTHLFYDPLKNELERIQKVSEQTTKNHEDMKLRLKSDFEKELEELHRKYDAKFQEMEVEFQQRKKTLDASLNIVRVNKILADAFRLKCLDLKLSGASGMQQDSGFAQQSLQLSRQQSATWPVVVGPPSSGPPTTSLQCPSTASSHNMVPPIQAGYSVSGIFSNVAARPPLISSVSSPSGSIQTARPPLVHPVSSSSGNIQTARPPLINSVSSPSGNIQAGGEIRAPAPHLQPYRPSTSVPASSLPALLHGMPCRPAPGNVPAASPPQFPIHPPRPKLTTYMSDTHMGRQPDSVGRLAPPNLPAVDLLANATSQSAINLANFQSSRSGTSSTVLGNSSHQAPSPDLVCLSDDE